MCVLLPMRLQEFLDRPDLNEANHQWLPQLIQHLQCPYSSTPFRWTQATLPSQEIIFLVPPIGYVPQFHLAFCPQANEAKRQYPIPAYVNGSRFVAIKTSIKKGFMRMIGAPRVGCRGKRPLSNGSTGLARLV